MKPILYESQETAFTTNGIGILSDAISCVVKQELNGQYELTLQYPLKGLHAAGIAQRNIILAKVDPVSDLQPFRIYKIHKPMNNAVTVNARHIAYDLSGVAVTPFTAASAPLALAGLSANAVTDCPFTFWTDKTTSAGFTVAAPNTVWTLLGGVQGSVLDVYGGEYEYDRWALKLHSRRGADRGVSIRYGKNLTSLEQDENCASCYTGVMPYWVDRKTGDVTMLSDRVVAAEGNFGYTKILPVDLSGEFETAPTEEQLTAAARTYMTDNKICEPTVGWKVEYVALEQTEEYKGKALLERVLLGDTVHVDFADMDISVSARAVAAEYDCIMERYKSVTLGSVKANLASTIVNQNKEIGSLPTQSKMESAMLQLTNTILGVNGGSVRLLDNDGDGVLDTLYIADNSDPALAVKVWRFNYEGWGASKNGYNGPFVMGATFDAGIVADFITSGSIRSADGSIVIQLDGDGAMNVLGENGAVVARISRATDSSGGGITFSDISGTLHAIAQATSVSAGFRLAIGNETVAYLGLEPDGNSVLKAKNINCENVKCTGAFNRGKTKLYSGTISKGGSFDVTGTENYNLFAIAVGSATATYPGMILAYKYGNTIHGMGGWGGDSSYKKRTYWVSIEFTDDTWTMVHGSWHELSLSTGAWSAGEDLVIRGIYGVI